MSFSEVLFLSREHLNGPHQDQSCYWGTSSNLPRAATEVGGCANFYRHFIRNCSSTGAPLNCLVFWNLPLQWSIQAVLTLSSVWGGNWIIDVQVSQFLPKTQPFVLFFSPCVTATGFWKSQELMPCSTSLRLRSPLECLKRSCPLLDQWHDHQGCHMSGNKVVTPVIPILSNSTPAAVSQTHFITQSRKSGFPPAITLCELSLTSWCLSLWGPSPSRRCSIQWKCDSFRMMRIHPTLQVSWVKIVMERPLS